MGTKNTLINSGSGTVLVLATGLDSITNPQQATPQQASVTLSAGASVTLFYTPGIWYVIAEVPITTSSTLSPLPAIGTSGQVLTIGGSGSTGLEWLGPVIIAGELTTPHTGAPVVGLWSEGQAFLDSANVLWVCTVGGTPGTWVQVNALGSNPGGKAHISGAQIMLNNTQLEMALSVLDNLSGGMTQNGNGLVVPVTGYYAVTGQIRNSGFSGTWIRQYAWIYIAGGPATFGGDVFPTPGAQTADPISMVHDDRLFITAGQKVTLQGYQINSASAAQTTTNDAFNFLSVTLVST